jgi:hypothetical protein
VEVVVSGGAIIPCWHFSGDGGAQIQVRPHAIDQYLTLARLSGFDAEMS